MVTGVARLHCLAFLWWVVRSLLLMCFLTLCQSSSSRVSSRLVSVRYSWRVRTGLNSLPELETLHCRVYYTCTCTAGLSAPALPGYLHVHCVLELSNKDCLLTRNWILSFCTVTERSDQDGSSECVRFKRLFISQ